MPFPQEGRMGRSTRYYSMRTLVLIALGGTLLFFFSLAVYLLYHNMSGMLTRAENRHVQEQGETVIGALEAALQNAEAVTRDYARRDETMSFILGKQRDRSVFRSIGWTQQKENFDLVFIKDLSGADLLANFYTADGQTIPVPDGFSGYLSGYTRRVLDRFNTQGARHEGDSGNYGVLIYKGVPYYVCIMPVPRPNDPGTPAGTLTFGYILNNQRLQGLIHSSDMQFFPQPAASLGAVDFGTISVTKDTVSIAFPLKGLSESDNLVLNVSRYRNIHKTGSNIILRTIFALFVVMVLFAATLFLLIRRYVLHPIVHLSTDVGSVARSYTSGTGSGGIVNREFYALCTSITELLENLERSREAEEQSQISIGVLQSILNGMDAYLYVSDPETDEILFINDKMREHFGLKDGGVGQICWKVLQQGFDRRCSFCPNHTLIKDPDTAVVWEEHNTVTGHYYRNTDRLISWVGGRKVHLQHSADITESKLAEAALQKRLEQQELMSAITQGFISSGSMDEFINRSLRLAGEFLGVDRIRLGHHDGSPFLPVQYQWRGQALLEAGDEDLPLFFDESTPLYYRLVRDRVPYIAVNDVENSPEFQQLAGHGASSFLVLPLHVGESFWGLISFTKTQPYAWTESDIHLARLIDNVLSGVISRRHMEERLVHLSSVVSSSPQYVAYMNTGLAYEYVNDSVLDLTGYSREELMANDFLSILDGGTRAEFEEIYFPALLELGNLSLTMPIRCKSGEQRHLSFSFFPLDDSRQRIGAIAADITEKVRLEKEMLEAKEQAEKSSQAKGEFLSRMSHEMRTPMNAIIGMTNIAKSSDSPERKEYCLDKIADASQHLLGVINDILDMSKIEANKFELSFAEFRFEKMLTQVVNVINFKVDEKKQTLIVDVAPDVPQSLLGDEQRLSQVITNLLSNATKFTPEQGTLTLTVRKSAEENGLCTLHLAVRDTGIGISAEQQERLFRSFEQADGGIARRFGGTGLGLAICKKLVELMGGEIWVESELGRGATFHFTLKAQRGKDDAPVRLARDIRPESLRVLAVDDAPEAREYMLHAMELLHVPCEVASGGEEALELIKNAGEKPYDLILVDWMMPGMDGIELSRHIRGMADVNSVIIMVSVAAWSDIEKEAKAAGIMHFIQKPIFLAQLAEGINKALGRAVTGSGAEIAQTQEVPRFPGKTILLAEDNEINREIALALLEESGLAIHCAADGREAVDMFQQNSGLYSLIFMDIHMPEVDGYEASRRIRALPLPRARTIPIVAMTANVFREDIEKCLAAGMDAHIGKPLDTDELHAVLRRFLQDS